MSAKKSMMICIRELESIYKKNVKSLIFIKDLGVISNLISSTHTPKNNHISYLYGETQP